MVSLTLLVLALAGSPQPTVTDAFRVSELSKTQLSKMVGVTWREGCPVGLDKLREVHVRHQTPKGKPALGLLIVHQDVAQETLEIFRKLLEAGFVIEEIRPAAYGAGDDDHLMATNTTSGFNCRKVTGGKGFSKHSYGRALDINPLWNPYVKGKKVMPPKGAPYARNRKRLDPKGLMLPGSLPVRLFKQAGWTWGGNWKSLKDFQHVEKKRYAK
ncbi:MAG: M15 family metallopeptidase [Deltaproteobacteria bacterium]|jgi:hypothetical protein|nr:M15 family metallopeptidase [Deltaproteobacteria bacterium]